MAAIAAARLASVTILFCAQVVLFTVHMILYARKKSSTSSKETKIGYIESWIAVSRHSLAIIAGFVAAVLAISVFSGQSIEHHLDTVPESCVASVDADIAGEGLRLAYWAQEGILVLVLCLGLFHCNGTGAKEIGAGIAITHVSLGIALLVQMSRGSLSATDAILGVVILDSQNSALSLQFFSKEMLAARWQVFVIIPCQAFGLVLIPIFVKGFNQGSFATGDCSCTYMFLWAWLSSCQAFPSLELTIFWLYYASRCCMCLRLWIFSILDTPFFHHAEKEEKDGVTLEGISMPELGVYRTFRSTSSLSRPQYRHIERRNTADAPSQKPERPPHASPLVSTRSLRTMRDKSNPSNRFKYRHYPSTVSFVFIAHAVLALASMVAAELNIHQFSIEPSSQVVSVGQITGIVVATATISRGLWLFLRMFSQARRVWPLSFDVAQQFFIRRDRVTEDDTFHLAMSIVRKDSSLEFSPPSSLRLGSVLKKPDAFGNSLFPLEGRTLERSTVKVESTTLEGELTQQLRFPLLWGALRPGIRYHHHYWFQMEGLEKQTLSEPKKMALQAAKEKSVAKLLETGTLYLVTSIVFATNLEAEVDGWRGYPSGRVVFAYALLPITKDMLQDEKERTNEAADENQLV